MTRVVPLRMLFLWASTTALRMPMQLRAPFARPMENALLAAASGGTDALTLLRQFEELERSFPPPSNLLDDERSARDLAGRWELVATIAGQVGATAEELSKTGVSGVVNASGISVSATSAIQEIDLSTGRISNEVPVGQRLYVRVGGGFEAAPPPAVRRANVEFDNLEVFTREGARLFSAGWLFTLVRALRPSLTNGADSESWLETTYLSDRVRLGRGNKGSVFVLQRVDDGGGPLPKEPLRL